MISDLDCKVFETSISKGKLSWSFFKFYLFTCQSRLWQRTHIRRVPASFSNFIYSFPLRHLRLNKVTLQIVTPNPGESMGPNRQRGPGRGRRRTSSWSISQVHREIQAFSNKHCVSVSVIAFIWHMEKEEFSHLLKAALMSTDTRTFWPRSWRLQKRCMANFGDPKWVNSGRNLHFRLNLMHFEAFWGRWFHQNLLVKI